MFRLRGKQCSLLSKEEISDEERLAVFIDAMELESGILDSVQIANESTDTEFLRKNVMNAVLVRKYYGKGETLKIGTVRLSLIKVLKKKYSSAEIKKMGIPTTQNIGNAKKSLGVLVSGKNTGSIRLEQIWTDILYSLLLHGDVEKWREIGDFNDALISMALGFGGNAGKRKLVDDMRQVILKLMKNGSIEIPSKRVNFRNLI